MFQLRASFVVRDEMIGYQYHGVSEHNIVTEHATARAHRGHCYLNIALKRRGDRFPNIGIELFRHRKKES